MINFKNLVVSCKDYFVVTYDVSASYSTDADFVFAALSRTGMAIINVLIFIVVSLVNSIRNSKGSTAGGI